MAGEIKHEWVGTTLMITSDSGTSGADLKGEKGDTGVRGAQGAPGVIYDEDGNLLLEGYATKSYVDSKISAIPSADLSNYYTKTEIDTIANTHAKASDLEALRAELEALKARVAALEAGSGGSEEETRVNLRGKAVNFSIREANYTYDDDDNAITTTVFALSDGSSIDEDGLNAYWQGYGVFDHIYDTGTIDDWSYTFPDDQDYIVTVDDGSVTYTIVSGSDSAKVNLRGKTVSFEILKPAESGYYDEELGMYPENTVIALSDGSRIYEFTETAQYYAEGVFEEDVHSENYPSAFSITFADDKDYFINYVDESYITYSVSGDIVLTVGTDVTGRTVKATFPKGTVDSSNIYSGQVLGFSTGAGLWGDPAGYAYFPDSTMAGEEYTNDNPYIYTGGGTITLYNTEYVKLEWVD